MKRMRTRRTIEKKLETAGGFETTNLMIELLLDLRELVWHQVWTTTRDSGETQEMADLRIEEEKRQEEEIIPQKPEAKQ